MNHDPSRPETNDTKQLVGAIAAKIDERIDESFEDMPLSELVNEHGKEQRVNSVAIAYKSEQYQLVAKRFNIGQPEAFSTYSLVRINSNVPNTRLSYFLHQNQGVITEQELVGSGKGLQTKEHVLSAYETIAHFYDVVANGEIMPETGSETAENAANPRQNRLGAFVRKVLR